MTANSRKRRKFERKLQRKAQQKAEPLEAKAETEAKPEPVKETKKPLRKRVQRLLETAAGELEQAEADFLDEMLQTAHDAIELHHAEVRQRKEALSKGEELPKRWQVSPAVADRLMAKGFRIIEIRLARRRALNALPKSMAG